MKVVIVNSVDGFNDIYKEFKKSALIHKNPDIYHIGLDTEYISNDVFTESFSSIKCQGKLSKVKICIIQIATNDFCIILKVHEMVTLPIDLINILSSSNWIKTGVGIDLDLNYCFKNFKISGLPSYIDLKTFGFLEGEKTPNFQKLVNNHITKGYQKSSTSVEDWTKNLNDQSIIYIFEDAYYSYLLGKRYIPNSDGKFDIIEDFDLEIVNTPENYVSRLQEYCQKKKIDLPVYNIEKNMENGILKGYNVSCTVLDITESTLSSQKKTGKQFVSKELCLHFYDLE